MPLKRWTTSTGLLDVISQKAFALYKHLLNPSSQRDMNYNLSHELIIGSVWEEV